MKKGLIWAVQKRNFQKSDVILYDGDVTIVSDTIPLLVKQQVSICRGSKLIFMLP